MKTLYDVPAPAKLNLFLHIVGQRADGYHLLQSAFVLIDWCDTLHFECRADGNISREDIGASLPAEDLIVRAAIALQLATGTRQGAHITIDKQIPAQAGLGGGSSDAASTLLALNRLWRLNLSAAQLGSIGLKLGADVPFFLAGQNAWVEGVGEVLTPVTVPRTRFVVLKPTDGLATEKIFSSPGLKRNTGTAIISGFAADPIGFGHNDLQNVAEALCPGVTQALEWLASRGLSGRMTGSGSAVFAQAQQDIDLSEAPDGFQARLCHSLEAHPLIGWASIEGLSVGSV
jgi:4-diphosphocytidyl-2-C-methyl-D-erythritol kinase